MDSPQTNHHDLTEISILLHRVESSYAYVTKQAHNSEVTNKRLEERVNSLIERAHNSSIALGNAEANLAVAEATIQKNEAHIQTLDQEIKRLKEQGGEDREREDKEDEALDAGIELTKAALNVSKRYRKYRRWRDGEMNRLNAAAESCQAMLVALGIFEYRDNGK